MVVERLGSGSRKIAHLQTSKQELLFDYPFSPAEAVAFFRKYFGPTQTTFARLDEPPRKPSPMTSPSTGRKITWATPITPK